jgi:hypothetical protein
MKMLGVLAYVRSAKRFCSILYDLIYAIRHDSF